MKHIIIFIAYLSLIPSLYSYNRQQVKKGDDLLLEMIESSTKGDTLVIVSTADYLFHPFNKTVDPMLFDSKLKFDIEKTGDNVYLLIYASSFLRLALSDETNVLEIIEAKIADKDIMLGDEIYVTMKKEDFYSYFNLAYDNSINTIEMISGLQGVWHYYHFRNDILESIYIKSDYSL